MYVVVYFCLLNWISCGTIKMHTKVFFLNFMQLNMEDNLMSSNFDSSDEIENV